jgi:Zn finger protein HypA/HybF involved in hydrogenase expression
MDKEHLLIECNIKSVRERLETTLSNLEYQKGQMFWDDKEKIEHCIEALKHIEKDTTHIFKDNCWKCGEYIEYTNLSSFCPKCLTQQ